MGVDGRIQESINAKEKLKSLAGDIENMGESIVECLKAGNKILIAGNGGSAADAQHMAAELVGRFRMEREGLPCIALTTDSSILTSVGNDYGFDSIFERQIESLGRQGDIFIGISTSGKSENIIRAVKKA
ncbi:MAG: SIS domain-containing protein, partial [Candidatus Woesearchaeota archaeon]